jgi:hypothetical protein
MISTLARLARADALLKRESARYDACMMTLFHRLGFTPRPLLRAAGALMLVLLTACADTGGVFTDGGGIDGVVGPCVEGQKRCFGQSHRQCQGGVFVTKQECPTSKICLDDLACVDCDPTLSKTCVGNDVYTCTSSGQQGTKVESCGAQVCKNGFCGSQSCSQGTGLIYLVDDTNRFLSFNPENNANTLTELGTLKCSASASWPAWASPTATPFSMSVDRKGKAWVLYTSGEIFSVDVKTVACTSTSFSKGQKGYELFGMGFVSDAKGSEQEKLFIHGGEVAYLENGNLGYIDPTSLAITTVGKLSITGTEHSPELTGTGNGELFAFFPNGAKSVVRKIDKTKGITLQSWTVGVPSTGDVMAWAFAHWGGKFYVFITIGDLFTENSMILLLDPDTGQTVTLLKNLKYRIVGAGVSTCAPTID